MEKIDIQAKLFIDFLQPIKKALLEKDIANALKLLSLMEAMAIAAIDFEAKHRTETAYEAKVALMEAANSADTDARNNTKQ